MAKMSGLGWLTIPADLTTAEVERLKARWRELAPHNAHRVILLEDKPAYAPMSTPTLAGITAWVTCPRCGWEHYALIIRRWRNKITRECQECGQPFYQQEQEGNRPGPDPHALWVGP